MGMTVLHLASHLQYFSGMYRIMQYTYCMNRLNTAKRVQVISALVEDVSINATCRMSGVARHTVLNLLRDLGCAAASFHHCNVRGLKVKRLQCDQIWAFWGAKAKNVTVEQKAAFGPGRPSMHIRSSAFPTW